MNAITIRAPHRSEIPLVYSSWIKPLRTTNDREHEAWHRTHVGDQPIAKRIFCEGLHKRIDALLNKPSTKVLVAALDDDITVAGYIVFDYHLVHWVSVKKDFRNMGIGRMLFQAAACPPNQVIATFRTPMWSVFAKKLGITWTYNPYL